MVDVGVGFDEEIGYFYVALRGGVQQRWPESLCNKHAMSEGVRSNNLYFCELTFGAAFMSMTPIFQSKRFLFFSIAVLLSLRI